MSNPSGEKCPVDHSSRSKWADLAGSAHPQPLESSSSSSVPGVPSTLPTDREISSIPRTDSEKWVYPSEAQFFAAMARKKQNPHASDMRVIVPIHNAVNEHAWAAVKEWETGRGGETCGGVRLVNFKGKPGYRSPKAWFKVMLGYSAPFDRHDWVIDRCGVRLRYVIDFYTGRPDPKTPHSPSFYIDARPALDNWEGVKMRAGRFFDRLMDKVRGPTSNTPSLETKSPPTTA